MAGLNGDDDYDFFVSEENKIRDAADAIKGVVEAVPVYEDALQPAAKEVGKALQTVAKTLHVLLAPVSSLVWGYEQIKDFVSAKIAERLKDVPTERLRAPEPYVAGPLLEALRYTGYQETLRDLYANLLASSIDSKTAHIAHPSFVEMIRQMAPDEALIMQLLSNGLALPFLDIRAQEKGKTLGQWVVRYASFIPSKAGCEHPDLGPVYLVNLQRLGLVELREEYSLQRCKDDYDRLCEIPEIKKIGDHLMRSDTHEAITIEGTVLLTDLGEQFCRACILMDTHK